MSYEFVWHRMVLYDITWVCMTSQWSHSCILFAFQEQIHLTLSGSAIVKSCTLHCLYIIILFAVICAWCNKTHLSCNPTLDFVYVAVHLFSCRFLPGRVSCLIWGIFTGVFFFFYIGRKIQDRIYGVHNTKTLHTFRLGRIFISMRIYYIKNLNFNPYIDRRTHGDHCIFFGDKC